MKEKIETIIKNAKEESLLIKTEADYLNIKSKYLGKKSELVSLMSTIKDMTKEDKQTYGPLFNKTKTELENLFKEALEKSTTQSLKTFDPTLPVDKETGTIHPVTIVAKEVTDILKNMGFIVLTGPEMDSEYYNFEALNVPKTHPARDMQDTYWLSNGMLLRTQTSALQVRGMLKYGSPIKMCAPGRCFRNEDLDACHENTFFQLEGFVDMDETGEEGVAREVKEETGLEVIGVNYQFSIPNLYLYSDFLVHTLDMFYVVKVKDLSHVEAMDDAEESYWISLSNLHPEEFGLGSIRQGVVKFLAKHKTKE